MTSLRIVTDKDDDTGRLIARAALYEQVQHLMIAVESILRATPEGLSELALIRALQSKPWHLLGKVDFSQPERLYPVHFLVFHVLYRLRDEVSGQGEKLNISPLTIRLGRDQTVSGRGWPEPTDKLRAFYLDLSQYQLSEASIGKMMDDFWSGRSFHYPASEEAAEAASILGFSQLPDSFDEIKYRFRRSVMLLHPDRGGDTAKVQELNEAFGTLRRYFNQNQP
ncbi:DNA-J related domain-containing protein [Marinobacter caseinilyticus]|uniref:DNA-J related domain-containing protein n=1 Tax=Marinobacter caseinilyticus TaxID=2692195 RepID=UPI00140ABB38|nr:DNA-J related domain-containing protein [Marinobacter caseinilyticus]